MRYRNLGTTGISVSEIGVGGWGIGGIQWLGGDDAESLAALRRGFELGINFIDTALAYGDGHSEKLVGRAVRDAPGPVYVATKIPPMNRVWPAQPGVGIERVFPRDHVLRSTEESLRNLGRERIDLQQLHVWNPEWTAAEGWRCCFEELKASGKVRAVGISVTEHEPDTVLDALRTGLVDCVQVIYNIFDQSAEARLFPLCAQTGVGVIVRVPLDEGSLAGDLPENFDPGDFRAFYFRGDRKAQVRDRVAQLRKDLGDAPLAETALRFCLSHPVVSTVIPGMRRPRHVELNCAASEKGALPPSMLDTLRKHAWQRSFYC